MKKRYTVFVDEKLWENVIDDMNTTASWAIGGIIFSSKKKVNDFIKNARRYDENAKYEIIEVKFSPSPE